MLTYKKLGKVLLWKVCRREMGEIDTRVGQVVNSSKNKVNEAGNRSRSWAKWDMR